jgi:hypothetical protein
MWIAPAPDAAGRVVPVHASAAAFADVLDDCGYTSRPFEGFASADGEVPVLTRVLDTSILDWLDHGGSAVLLPDNQAGSFPLQAHWFLRGSPVLSDHAQAFGTENGPAGWLAPRQMIVELQTFDLAGDVIPAIEYVSEMDPLLMLWETHDLDHVKTNGLVFRMPVGSRGQLLVSALRHEGDNNPAGRYLLHQMLTALADHTLPAPEADDPRGLRNLVRLREEAAERRINLETIRWKFRPDPSEEGVSEQWNSPETADHDWETLRIDGHWESQGYPTLDGWAWYRHTLEIPADWPEGGTWLRFTGVDDYYDLYINGEKAGSGGDIEKRETAFDLTTSHEITRHVRPGEPLVIAVAVYDWYGAGGIFRPVELTTRGGDGTVRRMLR